MKDKNEFLISAIVSGAMVIGLLIGLPLGHIARNFNAAPPSSESALPQLK